ncbi:MAG: NADP-dependent malic enzyme [Candidatus Electryonea clarkiae]|nr:NADP-dependent malic enzyme [Candidatus Electryonea clarkiae]MDP8288239.1 NADP-dependent malic enzyme [Candidatus Electryonea clarkiae]
MSYDREAIEYHSQPRPGKIEVRPIKPCITQRDLSLAYTPGVAVPCLEIEKNPEKAYLYTSKGNLVGVVSNGTAVLGLGDIGPLAGKPVMEGKGVLFKRFAGVDVFDIELDTKDPDEIIRTCEIISPTLGGINLEDIKAPECFYIEETLKERLDIPVFHDDQHGTAIISGAALLNALEVIGKDISKLRVVFSGAGAAGIACAKFYEALGVSHDNIFMCDSKGVLWKGREDLDPSHPKYNKYKAYFTQKTNARTLDDAIRDADAFAGVSIANCVTADMVRSMAKNPIIFAMANPDPEITYPDAKAARDDVIIATGRSDYPNQVNNVLGFPFIFRGALDVRAKGINEEMKIAAARSLAGLAKEDVPDSVRQAYHAEKIQFGKDYLIPKPFDPRVLTWEAVAVAKAACESGIARYPITDWEEYRDRLEQYLGTERPILRRIIHRAQQTLHRVVFAEGVDERILRAAHLVIDERIGKPVLLGDKAIIEQKSKELGLSLSNAEIIKPETSEFYESYVDEYYKMRQRKGVNIDEARLDMRSRNIFGPMMVRRGDADVFISARSRQYPNVLRPMLKVMSDRLVGRTLCGIYMLIADNKQYFLGDTAVNIDPGVNEIVGIAEEIHHLAKSLGISTPRIALLSFSNFGSVRSPSSDKMSAANKILWEKHPDWQVDGEVQADAAVSPEIMQRDFPFSKISKGANCLVFPNLDSANTSFRLLNSIGGRTVVGPIIAGLDLPMHIILPRMSVDDIVNLVAIGVNQAMAEKNKDA